MKIEDTVRQYINDERLIFIERRELDDCIMECIPVCVMGSWAAVVNTEDFKNNGYKLICFDDISDIFRNETSDLRERVYKNADKNLYPLPDFGDAADIAKILHVLKTNGILVSIDSEEDGDCLYYTGKIEYIKGNMLTMLCYDGLARWDDENTVLDIRNINTITFYDRCSLILSKYLK